MSIDNNWVVIRKYTDSKLIGDGDKNGDHVVGFSIFVGATETDAIQNLIKGMQLKRTSFDYAMVKGADVNRLDGTSAGKYVIADSTIQGHYQISGAKVTDVEKLFKTREKKHNP